MKIDKIGMSSPMSSKEGAEDERIPQEWHLH